MHFCLMSSMTEQIRLHSLPSQKDLWDKLKTFFGTTGFIAVLHLFNQVPLKHVRTQHTQTDIIDMTSLLDHTTLVGLIFLKSSVLWFSSTIFLPSIILSPSLKPLPLPTSICNMSPLPFSWRRTFRSHENPPCSDLWYTNIRRPLFSDQSDKCH